MTDPLHSPKNKIERAEELSRDLSREILAFFSQRDLCHFVTEDLDPQSGDRWVKIALVKSVPDKVLNLIAEAVYHLRSSLDQLAVALARANGKTNKGVYFPFAGDIKEFEAKTTQKKIEKLAPEAAQMIRDLKPYRGGNDELWGLSQLGNVDKHNIAFPVGTLATTSLFQGISVQSPKTGIKIPRANSRLDEGIKFCNLGASGTITLGGPGPNIQLKIGDMVFGDVEVFQGRPVIETLDRLGPLVVDIVTRFDGHC